MMWSVVFSPCCLDSKPHLFAGKKFFFKVIFLENRFLKNELFSDVWWCHEKEIGKHFPVFDYVMENELEINLLMFFF